MDQKLSRGYWKDRLVTVVEQGDEESLATWRNDLRDRILELEEQICYEVYDTYRRAQIVHRYAAKILSETKYRALMRNVERMLTEKDMDQVEKLKETISQHKRKADDLVEDKDEERSSD